MHLQNKYSWGSCENSKHETQLNKSNLRILSTDWQRVFKVCLSAFASPRLSRGFTIAARSIPCMRAPSAAASAPTLQVCGIELRGPVNVLPDWEKPLEGPQLPSLWISNQIPQLVCSEPKNRASASSPPSLCSSAGQSHLFPFNTTLPFVTLENRRRFS